MRTLLFSIGFALLSVGASRADVSDSGNLTINGQGLIVGTMTVQGSAFSVGGATLAVSGGKVGIGTTTPMNMLTLQNGDLQISTTAGSHGIIFQDGSKQTTASGAGTGVLTATQTWSGGNTFNNSTNGVTLATGTSLNLANNSTLTSNGALAYDQANTELDIGNDTSTQAVHLGAWNTYTPTWGGFSINPTCLNCRWTRIGRTVIVQVTTVGGGTSNSISLTMTVPVAAKLSETVVGFGQAKDNGAFPTIPCEFQTRAGSTTVDSYKDFAADPWTPAQGKDCSGTLIYEANGD